MMSKSLISTVRDHTAAVLKIAEVMPSRYGDIATTTQVEAERSEHVRTALDYFMKIYPDSPLKAFKDVTP